MIKSFAFRVIETAAALMLVTTFWYAVEVPLNMMANRERN